MIGVNTPSKPIHLNPEDEIKMLRTSLDLAMQMRDAARATSNKDLELRRAADARVAVLERALSCAASAIKCGEDWSPELEEMIGGALRG